MFLTFYQQTTPIQSGRWTSWAIPVNFWTGMAPTIPVWWGPYWFKPRGLVIFCNRYGGGHTGMAPTILIWPAISSSRLPLPYQNSFFLTISNKNHQFSYSTEQPPWIRGQPEPASGPLVRRFRSFPMIKLIVGPWAKLLTDFHKLLGGLCQS